jgi:hypothetical protein
MADFKGEVDAMRRLERAFAAIQELPDPKMRVRVTQWAQDRAQELSPQTAEVTTHA